jgi:probable HAF family extracellular repeat protein
MQDLNDLIPAGSGWELRSAAAINSSGQIVGEGLINGETRAFLATPATTTPDTTPPKVTSTLPAANATGIAPAANIAATFSEAMMANSINGTTFKLSKVGTTTTKAAAVRYDSTIKKATLNPHANPQRGARYKAMVTTGAKDLAGNQLDQNGSLSGRQQKAWTFNVRR